MTITIDPPLAALDGWMLARAPASSTTMDLGISFFLISVQCVALRILDLLIKTGWSVIFPVFAEHAGRG